MTGKYEFRKELFSRKQWWKLREDRWRGELCCRSFFTPNLERLGREQLQLEFGLAIQAQTGLVHRWQADRRINSLKLVLNFHSSRTAQINLGCDATYVQSSYAKEIKPPLKVGPISPISLSLYAINYSCVLFKASASLYCFALAF